jgi:hypothetical protein
VRDETASSDGTIQVVCLRPSGYIAASFAFQVLQRCLVQSFQAHIGKNQQSAHWFYPNQFTSLLP